MEKIIPILPCLSIKEQIKFYEDLGFDIVSIYTSPNQYAVVKYNELEIHFYGDKKMIPSDNPNMCFIKIDDVDAVYEIFTSNFKQKNGKIPRSGIPRISKPRDLKEDRRFTVSDISGNTFYIGTPNAGFAFLRTIENTDYAKNFEILYDLFYSKEDNKAAMNMLEKYFPGDITSIKLSELDMAKILLLVLDIHKRIGEKTDHIDTKLKKLLNKSINKSDDWEKILIKYNEIISTQ